MVILIFPIHLFWGLFLIRSLDAKEDIFYRLLNAIRKKPVYKIRKIRNEKSQSRNNERCIRDVEFSKRNTTCGSVALQKPFSHCGAAEFTGQMGTLKIPAWGQLQPDDQVIFCHYALLILLLLLMTFSSFTYPLSMQESFSGRLNRRCLKECFRILQLILLWGD